MWINIATAIVIIGLGVQVIVLLREADLLKKELSEFNIKLGEIDRIDQGFRELYENFEITRVAISDISEDFPRAYSLIKDIYYYNRMINKHLDLYNKSGYAKYDMNGRANIDKVLGDHFSEKLKEAHSELDKIRQRNN